MKYCWTSFTFQCAILIPAVNEEDIFKFPLVFFSCLAYFHLFFFSFCFDILISTGLAPFQKLSNHRKNLSFRKNVDSPIGLLKPKFDHLSKSKGFFHQQNVHAKRYLRAEGRLDAIIWYAMVLLVRAWVGMRYISQMDTLDDKGRLHDEEDCCEANFFFFCHLQLLVKNGKRQDLVTGTFMKSVNIQRPI